MTLTIDKGSNRSDTSYWRPDDLAIGPGSVYDDMEWHFKPEGYGFSPKQFQINWKKVADEPFNLTDPEWRPLLEETKCLIWTMLHDRASGIPLSNGGMGKCGSTFKPLVTWMMENGLMSFSEINAELSWTYAEWFRSNHARPREGKNRQRDLTFATAWQGLRCLVDAFRQAGPLAERGYKPMLVEPFDGLPPAAIVKKKWKLKKPKKLEPIPDHIANPILITAAKWVNERAEDIIALQKIWQRDVLPTRAFNRVKANQDLANNFVFSVDPQTGTPWTAFEDEAVRIDSGKIKRVIRVNDCTRRAVSDLVAACIILILGMTGMRSSDLASIEVKPDEAFPSCVTVKRSLDGLTDYFLLEGVETKSSGERHSWVLGARLSGTYDYPLPVKAVMVLRDLLAKHREATGYKNLVLSFTNARSIDPKYAAPHNSMWLSGVQREFATNHAKVPLSRHLRYENSESFFPFRSAQWRDTFAVFVVRTNKRALGPLATHFNHVNVMMTEMGYIGNDPALLRLVDDARLTLASNTIANLIDDDAPLTGGLAVLLRDAVSELKEATLEDDEERRMVQIKGVVLDYGIRLHFTDYGVCGVGIAPAASRCHEVSGDTSPTKIFPNFSTRRPGLCAGCRHFLVLQENLPYWEERVATIEAVVSNQTNETWRHARELALSRQIVKSLKEAKNARETTAA